MSLLPEEFSAKRTTLGLTNTGGFGTAILVEGNLLINDTTGQEDLQYYNSSNFGTGTVTLVGDTVGVYMDITGSTTLTEGSLNLENDGEMTIASGSFTATGVLMNTVGDFTMSAGSIYLTNNAITLTNATGVAITVGGTFTQTAGNIVFQTSSVNQPPSSAGVPLLISADIVSIGGSSNISNGNGQIKSSTGSFSIGGSAIISNLNSLTIDSTTVSSNYGAQVSAANLLSISSGFLSNDNFPGASVDDPIGPFYGSDVVVLNGGITMTGGEVKSTHFSGAFVSSASSNAGASVRVMGTSASTISGGASIVCENDGTVAVGMEATYH